MNGVENPVIFYSLAALILIFAGLAIKFKNIFYSLLCAMTVFFLVGAIFYILGSEYNAVIQIAIYGVAVPVILGLAIMFTDTKTPNKNKSSGRIKSALFLACGIFLLGMIYLVMTSLVIIPQGFNITEPLYSNSNEVIRTISNGIFVKYVWAFELVSLMLTIVAAGLTIFKKDSKREGN